MEQHNENIDPRNDERAVEETAGNVERDARAADGADGRRTPARRSASGGTRRSARQGGGRARSQRAYQPKEPRSYRTSEVRGHGAGAQAKVPDPLAVVPDLVWPIGAALIALLALISLIVAIASFTAPTAEDIAAQKAAEDAALTPSERVDASPSVADADGVVHGVTANGTKFSIHGAGEAGLSSSKVSFLAAGDQIASDYALELADAYGGEIGDDDYDFKPFYQEVKSFIQQSDLRLMSQETPLIGGQTGFPVSGYPMFVSPESCADAIADAGFNLVNFTTNHSYDAGVEGIEYSQQVWKKYPDIIVGGSFSSQDDRETVQLIERNGIRFAFLSYSYGDNSYENVSKEPNSYYAVAFDETSAAADIARAKDVADVIIVYMHWGDEYTTEINESQDKQAQWLADQGVDLVVGSHAHSIQPVRYYNGASGKHVPVVFGLGDFVSGWTLTDTILSGIFTCDFVQAEDGAVSIQNPVWHPTIEWSDGTGDTYVRLLENMNVADINANTRTEDWPGESFAHVYELTNETVTEIPVNWGSDAKTAGASGTAGTTGTANEDADDGTGDEVDYSDTLYYSDDEDADYSDDEAEYDDTDYSDDESYYDEDSDDEAYYDDEESYDDESSDDYEE